MTMAGELRLRLLQPGGAAMPGTFELNGLVYGWEVERGLLIVTSPSGAENVTQLGRAMARISAAEMDERNSAL
jgi:hypothetical protein